MISLLTVLALFAPEAVSNVRVVDPTGAGFLVEVASVPCTHGPHASANAAAEATAGACAPGAGCVCTGKACAHGAGCPCDAQATESQSGMGKGPGAGMGKGPGAGMGKGPGAGMGKGSGQGGGQGQGGVPAAARATIQSLVHGHAQVRRSVTILADGVETLTTSEAPEQVEAIRAHVRQMQSRLAEGGRMRGWDPVFAALATHYADTVLSFEDVPGGIKVTHRGKTAEAARLVHAHAQVVNRFATMGPEEAHRCHVVR